MHSFKSISHIYNLPNSSKCIKLTQKKKMSIEELDVVFVFDTKLS